jgi:hypothetical protein
VHVAEREGGAAREQDDGRKEDRRELAHLGLLVGWSMLAVKLAASGMPRRDREAKG